MKLLKLTYRGVFGKSGETDFCALSSGSTVAGAEKAAKADAILRLAKFGADGAEFPEDGAAVSLTFEKDGGVYTLARFWDGNAETVTLSFEIDGVTTEVPVAQIAMVSADTFGSADGKTDAACLTENDVLTKRAQAEAAEREAQVKICAIALLEEKFPEEEIPAVSVAALGEEKRSLELLLHRAAEKKRITEDAIAAQRALETFLNENKDIGRLSELLTRDGILRKIAELRRVCDEANRAAEEIDGGSAAEEAKKSEMARKGGGGALAEKECEADFIYKSERLNSFRKRFMDEISAADGETSEIRKSLSAFYTVNDPKIAELQVKKKRLDGEYEALMLSVTSLENKKKGLVRPMSYKKAVIDGTVLEYRIEKLTGIIEDGNRRSGELQLEINAKNEDIRDAEAAIGEKAGEKAALLKKILSENFVCKEDALNADFARKNNLYSDFVTAENLSQEIDALNAKVENLKRQNAENNEKRDGLNDAKAEIEIRILKLTHQLKTSEDGYRAKCAANIYAEEAAKLDYGARCPVCDGYVLKKNSIAKITTDGAEAEISKLKQEITVNEDKIKRILLKLGAYLSTTASGDAYLVSLHNTLTKKNAQLQQLYRAAGATDAESMRAVLISAGEESRTLNENVAKLNLIDGEATAWKEKKKVLGDTVAALSARESKRIRAAVANAQEELETTLFEYRKLMPVFDGKPAKELLSGSLVDDIELETVDGDLVSQTKNFRDVTVQKIETDRLLLLLKNRLISDLKDTESESAADVVLRETARKAKEIASEVTEAEKAYEDAKIKLSAVRRVNRRAEEEKSEMAEHETARAADAQAARNRAAAARTEIDALRAKLGGTANEKLLSDAECEKAKSVIADYEAKKARLTFRATDAAAKPVTLEYFDEEGARVRLAVITEELMRGAALSAQHEFFAKVRSELSAEKKEVQQNLAAAQDSLRILSARARVFAADAVNKNTNVRVDKSKTESPAEEVTDTVQSDATKADRYGAESEKNGNPLKQKA